MKTLVSALIISASVFAGAAYATDSSTITRAQVIAELQQAKAAGLISQGEQEYPPAVNSHSNKTRAQVLAELADAGQPGIGEQEYPRATATGSSQSRAQVNAELKQYASVGVAQQIEH